MKQDEAVRTAFAREVGERAVDLLLHLLLADERPAREGSLGAHAGLAGGRDGPRPLLGLAGGRRGLPRQVEEIEPREFAPGVGDGRLSVVVEDVSQIAARVPRVPYRIGVEQREKFGEREDAPPTTEPRLHLFGDAQDLRRGSARLAHGTQG